MRGLTMRALLVAMLLSACGSGATGPQATQPSRIESTTSASTTIPSVTSSTALTADDVPSTPVSGPADVQTSVAEPSTTTTIVAAPLTGPVVLRGDGLGEARFGDLMAEVEPWLVGELGDPWWESVARAPLAASQWRAAHDFLRTLTFEIGDVSQQTGHAATLVVVFSDVGAARDDGVVHLVAWGTSGGGSENLATSAGLTTGMSSAELREMFPSVQLGLTDPYGATGWFAITTANTSEAGIRGHLSSDDRIVRLEAGADSRRPDEIPAPPDTPDGPLVSDLLLRPDGLGPVDFHGSAGLLVATLIERFGPPAEEMNVRAPPGETLHYRVPLGYFPDTELRHLTWYDPGLAIVVADGTGYGGTAPGALRLVNWATSSSRLQLDTGLGVGSTLAVLTDSYTDITVGTIEECAGAYYPAGFDVTSDLGTLHGSINWDWISDIQRALNERGATLAVDGEYGPRTLAAVAAFQTEAEISFTAPWDSDGWIGPQTLDALDVAPPITARIERLFAGNPGSC